jgi:hypothetical protein
VEIIELQPDVLNRNGSDLEVLRGRTTLFFVFPVEVDKIPLSKILKSRLVRE